VNYHFISGLPRAGTTLLASLLRQNPSLTSSFMSPVGHCVSELQKAMSPPNEAHMLITDDQRAHMIEAVFDGYYEKDLDKIIFDNNRRWCNLFPLLVRVFPTCKMICCLRSPVSVVNSFEKLFARYPLEISTITNCDPNLTVYERAHLLMQPQGVVGFSLNATKSAFFGPYRDRILFIEYNDLAKYPLGVMAKIHEFFEYPTWAYDVTNLQQLPGGEAFDRSIGMPGLHHLRPKVTFREEEMVLPPDIVKALPLPFWINTSATNPR